ncbi:hypothetical protein EYF80_068404 [Liparis tanakae]|uniref:Uncharacterized protein n=1 Tax=Liparis tanakae TaxID=230148 RepID=A0A4Z2DY46_9TELE|nr:hypothetical protein EYF80_068404 [Liparis tanakae]
MVGGQTPWCCRFWRNV